MPFAPKSCLFTAAAVALLGGMAAPALAQTTIYDATSGAENGGDSIKSGGINLYDRIFNPSASTLASVTLNLRVGKADLGTFDVVVAPVEKKTGKPGKPVVVEQLSDNKLSGKFTLTRVTPASHITLDANGYYYVGIAMHPHGKNSVYLGNTVDPAILARPSVVAGANFYNTDGAAQPNAGGPYEISVAVTP